MSWKTTIPAATAGTVMIRTNSGVLGAVYVTGGAFGSVSVFDAAGTASIGGTPVLRWVPSAIDITSAKDVNIPCSNGIALVLAANTQVTVVHGDRPR